MTASPEQRVNSTGNCNAFATASGGFEPDFSLVKYEVYERGVNYEKKPGKNSAVFFKRRGGWDYEWNIGLYSGNGRDFVFRGGLCCEQTMCSPRMF
jgi:hypothetical protein